jgi:hypothetical protein
MLQQTPFRDAMRLSGSARKRTSFATLEANVALLLLVITELLRTSFWKGLTTFNYTNMKRVVVSSSAGGTRIAYSFFGKGQVSVKLVEHETGVVLTIASRCMGTEDAKTSSQISLMDLQNGRYSDAALVHSLIIQYIHSCYSLENGLHRTKYCCRIGGYYPSPQRLPSCLQFCRHHFDY